MAHGSVKKGTKVGVIGLAGVGKSIEEFADKGLEVVVDDAGFGTKAESCINVLSKFGVFMQVGRCKLEARLDTLQLITKQLTVRARIRAPRGLPARLDYCLYCSIRSRVVTVGTWPVTRQPESHRFPGVPGEERAHEIS